MRPEFVQRVSLISIIVLGASLGLAAPATAQRVKDTVTYKITGVIGAGSRSAIAATGADIFEAGHDYVLIEATRRKPRL